MEKEKFLDNQARLKACIQKVERGEELTLAFFGGLSPRGLWRQRRKTLTLAGYFAGGRSVSRRQSFIM